MASLYGLTLKNITRYKGHEGEPLQQGNIYYEGKKIGFYSDGDWGRPSTIDFDNPEAEKAALAACKKYYTDYPQDRWSKDYEPDLEEFFPKVFQFIDWEKYYKKMLKKGYLVLGLYQKGIHEVRTAGRLEDAVREALKKADAENPKIFTGLEDFILS